MTGAPVVTQWGASLCRSCVWLGLASCAKVAGYCLPRESVCQRVANRYVSPALQAQRTESRARQVFEFQAGPKDKSKGRSEPCQRREL